jgi:hypothetical protein
MPARKMGCLIPNSFVRGVDIEPIVEVPVFLRWKAKAV